jgi:hypothetical protein
MSIYEFGHRPQVQVVIEIQNCKAQILIYTFLAAVMMNATCLFSYLSLPNPVR